jgi:hypothetical protein
MIIFPDTNLLIHFRDPRELEWDDIVRAETIELAIGRTVQKELQKKRFELRGRSQDRARLYAKRLGDIAQAGEPEVLRETGPRVELVLMARPPGWTPPPDLAYGWGDDQLVADALAYGSSHPEADIAVLTDDAEVITTAHTHSISVLRPPCSWELPPETTPEAKKLAKVERELEEYRRSEPAIECEILDGSGATVPVLLLSASWRPPLEGQDAEALVLETIAAHPRVETFNRLGGGGIADESGWIVASESEIAAYGERYEKWRHELINHVARVGALSDDRTERFSLELALRNVGTRPAEQVRLILELSGGFIFRYNLRSDDDDVENRQPRPRPPVERFGGPPAPPALPRRRTPPSPPASPFTAAEIMLRRDILDLPVRLKLAQQSPLFSQPEIGQAATISRLLKSAEIFRGLETPFATAAYETQVLPPSIVSTFRPALPEPRDRNEFYFLTDYKERDGATRWEYECEAFPHRADDIVLELSIEAKLTAACTMPGALKVRVQADNLRKPFEKMIPIQLKVAQVDPVAFVRSTLPTR